jgi:hypothetical protein
VVAAAGRGDAGSRPVEPTNGSTAAGEEDGAAGEGEGAAEEAAGTITSGARPVEATTAIDDDGGGGSTAAGGGELGTAAAGVAGAGSDDTKVVDIMTTVEANSNAELDGRIEVGSTSVEFIGLCLFMCRGK